MVLLNIWDIERYLGFLPFETGHVLTDREQSIMQAAELQVIFFLTYIQLSPFHTGIILGILNAFIEISKPNTPYALLVCRCDFQGSSCKMEGSSEQDPQKTKIIYSKVKPHFSSQSLQDNFTSLKTRCNKMSTSWLAGASLPQFHIIAVFHQAEQNSSWPRDCSVLSFQKFAWHIGNF